jgi:hypothetical protein
MADACHMDAIPSARTSRAVNGASPRPERDAVASESTVVLIAGLCFLTGIIHVGVAAVDLQQFSSYAPLVVMIAAFQIGWAILVQWRPSRGLLIWGAAISAALVALWVTSRTVGLPVGPRPWVAEPIGGVDVIAAVAEVAIVLASASVLAAGRSAFARRAVSRMAPALLAVMFISVLYGVGSGVHVGDGSVWLCC